MMLSIFTTSLIVDEVVLQVSACAGKALSMNRTESHVRNNVSLSRRIITSRGLLCRLRIIHARPSPAEALAQFGQGDFAALLVRFAPFHLQLFA